MNTQEAQDIKRKYGDQAYNIALEIIQKKQMVSYWEDKEHQARYYMLDNKQKIEKLMAKLDQVISNEVEKNE